MEIPILFQNELSLEEYAGRYLDLFDDITQDEEELKQSFWGGLRDPLAQIILIEDLKMSFLEFVDHTLWACGSNYLVEDLPLQPVPDPVSPEPEPITCPPEPETVTCLPETEHTARESTQEDISSGP